MKINNVLNNIQKNKGLRWMVLGMVALTMSFIWQFPAEKSWMLGPFAKPEKGNPVLSKRKASVFQCPMTKKAVNWESDNVFNPAAVVVGREVYLLYRAEDGSGQGIGNHTSRLGLAVSADGIKFRRYVTPVLYPAEDAEKANEWEGGCEDPRIVESDALGYVITYTQWNRKTPRLAVATSHDLRTWTKEGAVFAGNPKFADIASKSGAIVTKQAGDHFVATKIDGKYWMYWGDTNIFMATSSDLKDWEPVVDAKGNLVPALQPRQGKFDSELVEPGPQAILTDKGIVLIYNGKNLEKGGDPALQIGTYAAGQALFDAANPGKLLDRSDNYFIKPEAPYEITGQYKTGTVFTEGLVHFKGKWFLYYGAADSKIGVAVKE